MRMHKRLEGLLALLALLAVVIYIILMADTAHAISTFPQGIYFHPHPDDEQINVDVFFQVGNT